CWNTNSSFAVPSGLVIKAVTFSRVFTLISSSLHDNSNGPLRSQDRVNEYPAMPDSQSRRLKLTEQSRTLQSGRLVPGSKRRKREQRSYDARDRNASLRLKSVSSNQCAVSHEFVKSWH